ncbi:MAG: site-specific integrase, partial [Oscillospiraceae bacterium]|nr:site-specific integrase [Oscillospiraceae bacterium]
MRKITNELILSFKNHLIEEEKSENTCVKYIRDITFFMTWLCGQEVTKLLALEYKKNLCEKFAPASVNSAISSLNSFFAYMEWHDIRIKTLKIQRKIFSSKDTELTKAEYERLLTAAKRKNNERL